jgi:L-alanine-DL-glutamate epimerase-like enolase superfamily enzyme
LTDEHGIEGHALGFARGVGVIEGIGNLSPLVIGQAFAAPGDLIRTVRRAFVPGWPGLIRSASLLDIAMWDIAAKQAGSPLSGLMSSLSDTDEPMRNRIPVVAIVGYFADRRTVRSVVDEVAARVAEGFTAIKVVLAPGIPGRDQDLLAGVRATVGETISVSCDAHWAYSSLADALAGCRPLLDFGLEFIEDPFPPQAWRLAKEFRETLGVRIAHGEDVVGFEGFIDAIDAADILRVDATSSGGITMALDGVGAAIAAGRSVLPVVWPDLHAGFAARTKVVGRVETIPRETGAELSWQLLQRTPAIVQGELIVSSEPGVGMDLDWQAVARSADSIAIWS